MKKILACVCLFLQFQLFSFLTNGVIACDKQISTGVDCSAVAVTRERTASFIFPKVTEKNWTWYLKATKDNYLEYLWEISLNDGENPPLYEFGAYLFKYPGSAQQRGTLKELLKTAQHSVVERLGNSLKARGDLEIQATVKESAVHVLIDDPETFDVLFGSKPSYACFQFSELEKEPVLCRTKIEYKAGSEENKWSIGKSPEEIVIQYCILDAKGKRLSSDTWQRVSHLITWRDEPGWDTAVVLLNFQIVSSMIDGKKAGVIVRYHNLGSTDSLDFRSLNEDELVRFELISENGIWKIVAPVNVPHVLPSAIVKHLQNLETTEPARKTQLALVIGKVEASFESSLK